MSKLNLFRERLRDSMDSLQPRERVFVSVGAVLVVLAAIYVALLPQWQAHSALTVQQAQLQADVDWLQGQRDVVLRLANGCSAGAVSANSGSRGDSRADSRQGSERLTRLVRRNQLKLAKISETSRGYNLRFGGADGNRMMRLAYQIACEGFVVQSFEITQSTVEGEALSALMEVHSID
jgi:hypothetical protein